MVIFHSCVSLPEGTVLMKFYSFDEILPEGTVFYPATETLPAVAVCSGMLLYQMMLV